ncbi:MAG: YIP1 family protein [Kouleothrix sp.]|nr:YIP1 family protein [Kouleothrix sp.]
MMIQGVSINEMLNQSITVLTKPSVQSFEQYERRGGQREALIYVGAAAALAGLVGAVFGLLTGGVAGLIGGLVIGIVGPLLSFFVFSFLVYTIGKSQGGTGTQDEVFYTCALYTAPIQAVTGIVGAIPLLGCLLWPATLILGLYQLYLGYLATRSSMNLDQNKAIITVVASIVAMWIAGAILTFILAAVGIGAAAASGALNR